MTIHLESISSLSTLESDDVRHVAVQMEAYFLRRMFAEMRSSSSAALLNGGTGGKAFQEMLDEALADEMAMAGGFGIAELIESQLKADK